MLQEIEWFCYYAVYEGLLEVADCRAVYDAMQEAGLKPELTVFVQTVVDNELSSRVDRLEELMNMAVPEAETKGFPPKRVLTDEEEPAPDEAEAEEDDEEAAPVSPPPRPAPAAEAGELPSLAGAESMSDDEARDFLVRYLETMRGIGASDVHLSAMGRPFYRKNLANQFVEETALSPEASEKLNLSVLTEEQKNEFLEHQDFDYSLAVSDSNRFRVNLMIHKNGIQGSYRLITDKILSLEELGFKNASVITDLLNHHNGIILVTGPAGCGKTTTLAALVAELNRKRHDNIITVEDPVEIVQASENCNINQREVGAHTQSFHAALKAALREDPDIIVIGEMRDLETIEMAVTAAETGHLVIGTLHTSDAASTLNRVLDVFPPSAQAQIRAMTSESLRGIICQRLLPGVNRGLVLAAEILIANTAVGNIIREGRMHQLKAVLQTGTSQGMTTMDNAVFNLFKEGSISAEVAVEAATEADTIDQIREGEAETAAAAEGQAQKPSGKKKGWFR